MSAEENAQSLCETLNNINTSLQEKRRPFRFVVTQALWWLLPFLTLWSLGVPPETAAQLAVAPYIVCLLTVTACMSVYCATLGFLAKVVWKIATIELASAKDPS